MFENIVFLTTNMILYAENYFIYLFIFSKTDVKISFFWQPSHPLINQLSPKENWWCFWKYLFLVFVLLIIIIVYIISCWYLLHLPSVWSLDKRLADLHPPHGPNPLCRLISITNIHKNTIQKLENNQNVPV